MSRLTRDETAEPVSRNQILRHERGQGNIHLSCSADHVQDWQPYPVDSYSCYMCDNTYIDFLSRCYSYENTFVQQLNRLYAQNPVFEIIHQESVKVYLHMYNGSIQQNPLCAASCVTQNIPISPRFSPTLFCRQANSAPYGTQFFILSNPK